MQGIQGSTVGLGVWQQHGGLTECLLFLDQALMVKRWSCQHDQRSEAGLVSLTEEWTEVKQSFPPGQCGPECIFRSFNVGNIKLKPIKSKKAEGKKQHKPVSGNFRWDQLLSSILRHLDMALLFELLLRVSKADELVECESLILSKSSMEMFFQLYMIILMMLVRLLLSSLPPLPFLSSLYALLDPP